MKPQAYLSILTFSTVLLLISCQDKEPRKAPVKKQIFTEKNDAKTSDTTPNAIIETPEDNIISVSEAQFNEYGMKLGYASTDQVNKSIDAVGYIEVPKENKAEIRSYIGGYLHSSPLLPGDYVNKGQFLISLKNLEYIQLQQDYLKAEEELTYLEEVYKRKKTLSEENITSINSRQQAESEYKSALVNVAGLRKKLQLISIDTDKLSADNITSTIYLYAPISGYLTQVNAIQGMFAEPTDVIFEIINTDHLHVKLKVYENDILKIKKGDKIHFQIPETEDNYYTGEVFLVGKNIEEEDRTVLVHCHIDEKAIPVIAGMFVEAKIIVGIEERFCLPASAFIREENNYYVFTNITEGNDGYTFKKVFVEVGEITEDCIEILAVSKDKIEGKEILIEGGFNL